MKNLAKPGIVAYIFITGFLFHFNCLAQESNWLVMSWWDEFNYSGAPDTSKWGYDVGGWGWGNNEEQYYTDQLKNSYVENGELHIEALKENDSWTSARMITKNKGLTEVYRQAEIQKLFFILLKEFHCLTLF